MTAHLYGAEFFAGRSPFVSASAAAVVPHLMDLLNPRSVFDVGCGQQAEWLLAFPDTLERIGGCDISFGPDHPWYADLTEPLYCGGDRFDLVLCLEVGEHLPEESTETLIDTLVSHSDNIVFSAAVPGQEGVGHINCQPHDFWHTRFGERGYLTSDVIRPLIADDTRVSPWYRNNMFLYQRGPS